MIEDTIIIPSLIELVEESKINFIIDDLLENSDENNTKSEVFLNILENNFANVNIKSSNYLFEPFREICNLIKKDLNNNQTFRFIEYTKEWIIGAKYLASISEDDILDERTYIHHRIKSIGAKITFFSIEYSLGINLEKDILESLNVLHDTAANIIILVNDLFSYRKEIYEKKYNPNMIDIFRNKNKLSLQSSIDTLVLDIKEKYSIFKKLCDEIFILYSDNENLKKYVDSLYILIIGNLKWSCKTPRYHGKDFKEENGFILINGAKVKLDKDKTTIIL